MESDTLARAIRAFGQDHDACKKWVRLPDHLKPLKAAWDVLNLHRPTHEKLLPFPLSDVVTYLERFVSSENDDLHSCLLILSHADSAYRAFVNQRID